MNIPSSRAEEQRNRDIATDPAVNAWVSANAGSGKTTLLGNRVIRLLLSGVAADRILCLTFTKAAAAEMQLRIFRQLSGWVMLDDEHLAAAIARLEGAAQPDTHHYEKLAQARTLFARAMETPGGLRIQTVHAFAERILRLFPIEAGVPIDFEVLSDSDALDLRRNARRAAIDEAVTVPSSALGLAFGEIAASVTPDVFDDLLTEAVDRLAGLRNRSVAIPHGAARLTAYRAALGVPEGETREIIEADFYAAAPDAQTLAAAATAIEAAAVRKENPDPQLRIARKFAEVARLRAEGADWHGAYFRLVTNASGTKPARNLIAVDITRKDTHLRLTDEAMRESCRCYLARLRALTTLHRSLALATFAENVLAHYSEAKRRSARLDFSDMIASLRDLLERGQSRWIMMKLDGAIEHILVDEAQDTTPEMWDCIRLLTEEFFAGEGRVARPRSIFVVGDEKQSIYSFQGADPLVFEATRLHFARKLSPLGLGAHVEKPVTLLSSFRSAPEILGAVDRTFGTTETREGITASTAGLHHRAAKTDLPGLVELWPLIRPDPDAASSRSWQFQPPAVVLADRIADTIAGWLRGGGRDPDRYRPIRAGDILVLVRTRNDFFTALLRAMKRRKIPVSGADRLTLQDEIAVLDLLVIARAALLREDDLALATALKTPIFGFDDVRLEPLARNRSASLWQAVQESTDALVAPAAARLARLAKAAPCEAPFEFFASLLDEPSIADPTRTGRAMMLTRLGTDAAEPIDVFLSEALEFSQATPGSLVAFVEMQATRKTEIKRDLAHSGDHVRIMTAHGAKGLEARIVFLGDTVGWTISTHGDRTVTMTDASGNHLLLWSGARDDEPDVMRALRADNRRRARGEYRRLLYVGMTRAAERLYVGGYAGKITADEIRTGINMPDPADPMELSWYQLVRRALADAPEVDPGRPFTMPARRIATERRRDVPEEARDAVCGMPSVPDAAPAWLGEALPQSAAAPGVLRPSRPIPARPPPDTDDLLARRRRGTLVHCLFEFLPRVPEGERAETGAILLRRIAPYITAEFAAALVEPVIAFLARSEGLRLFGPNSQAEVAITGTIILADGTPRQVTGRIDRLVVAPGEIDIVDIKTGRPRTGIESEDILRQLALYRALIAAIHPGLPIACHVLWTETATLETLSEAALAAAFDRIKPE